MNDALLLVPGTSGCKLERNGTDIGWPTELTAQGWLAGAARLWEGFPLASLGARPDALVSLLGMQFGDPGTAAPVRTTLGEGAITCGPVLQLVYNQFSEYRPFGYDWRSDIRDGAARLLDTLRRDRPGGGRWRILAHSQGGLLVVAASKLCAREEDDDDRAFSRLVSRVVLLATPLYGTVNAAEAILVGNDLAPPFSAYFRRIVRTWPAIHQMLPVWPGCVRRRTPDGREETVALDLTDEAPWAGQQVDPAMLERARRTRADFLDAPLSRMNGVDVHILMSASLPTRDHVVLRAGDGFDLSEPSAPGDGLVPEAATRLLAGDVERARMITYGGAGHGATLQHFAIADDPVIASAVKDFLEKD